MRVQEYMFAADDLHSHSESEGHDTDDSDDCADEGVDAHDHDSSSHDRVVDEHVYADSFATKDQIVLDEVRLYVCTCVCSYCACK